jgi:hypothetical protein
MAQAKIDSTPIADTYGTPELFAMELSALENLGPCYRLTFTNPDDRVAVPIIRLILPADAVQQMLLNLPMLMRNLPMSKPNHESELHLN